MKCGAPLRLRGKIGFGVVVLSGNRPFGSPPHLLRAFSAGPFIYVKPRARRLALGYKYFTATRFFGLVSRPQKGSAPRVSQLHALPPLTNRCSLLTSH